MRNTYLHKCSNDRASTVCVMPPVEAISNERVWNKLSHTHKVTSIKKE